MYKINFNHLHYFLTIAQEGTIVKAAKKLHITQPALSHQLRLLEEDLEVKLFDRKGRRLVLNDHGRKVQEYASKIFRHSEEMIHYLKSDTSEAVRIIKIGVVPWLSVEQVYRCIKGFILSPHLRVQVYQMNVESLLKDIQEGKLDLVLCDSPYSGRSKKLVGRKLNSEKIYCVSSRPKKKNESFPQCLEGMRILNYSDACQMRDNVELFLAKSKANFNIVGEFADISLMRVATESGRVASFLPESLIKNSLKEKLLFKLGELKGSKFELWAITSSNLGKDNLIYKILNSNKF